MVRENHASDSNSVLVVATPATKADLVKSAPPALQLGSAQLRAVSIYHTPLEGRQGSSLFKNIYPEQRLALIRAKSPGEERDPCSCRPTLAIKLTQDEQLTAKCLPQFGGGSAYDSMPGCSVKGVRSTVKRRSISEKSLCCAFSIAVCAR